MYVIVVGCGRLGSLVAQILSNEGHNVVVIDNRKEAFNRLGPAFNGGTIEGFGLDEEVLQQAGIQRAEAFVAATDSDNLNFAVATVAKKVFQVPHVVACISDPYKEYAYQRMGVHTICPAVLGAMKIRDEILKEG